MTTTFDESKEEIVPTKVFWQKLTKGLKVIRSKLANLKHKDDLKIYGKREFKTITYLGGGEYYEGEYLKGSDIK